jgi:hypothetical protein
MIPMTLLIGLALAVYFRMFLRLSLLDYLRRSCVSGILVQAPFIAALVIIRSYYTPATLAAFFGAVALAALPYFAITIFVCVTRSERRVFLKALSKFTLLFRPRFS